MDAGINNRDIEPKPCESDEDGLQHASDACVLMMLMVAMRLNDQTHADIEPEIDEDDFPELTNFLNQSENSVGDRDEDSQESMNDFDEDFYLNHLEGPDQQWGILKSCIPEYREWK